MTCTHWRLHTRGVWFGVLLLALMGAPWALGDQSNDWLNDPGPKPSPVQPTQPAPPAQAAPPAAAAIPAPGPAQEADACTVHGIEFVRIPAGTFTMGSPASEPGRKPDEGPAHTVTITAAFWMSKYEITQGQWNMLMGENPSANRLGDGFPVENVSWIDCHRFLEKLNASAPGFFRLPSEAEWEYACRAGSPAAYCFGDDMAGLDAVAWHNGNSGGAPHPVGQKSPNAWGLYDMHGNVYEWCQDFWKDGYGNASKDGSACTTGKQEDSRVRRGGSWDRPPDNARSAFRGSGKPDNRRNDAGLRIVLVEIGPVAGAGPAGKAIVAAEQTPLLAAPSKQAPAVPWVLGGISQDSPLTLWQGWQVDLLGETPNGWVHIAANGNQDGWTPRETLLITEFALANVSAFDGDLPGREGEQALHGKFPPGLPVALIGDQTGEVAVGVTGAIFSMFNEASGEDLSFTKVDNVKRSKPYALGVVGTDKVLSPALSTVEDEQERAAVASRAEQAGFRLKLKDVRRVNEVVLETVQEARISGAKSWLLQYATPENTGMVGPVHLLVLLSDDNRCLVWERECGRDLAVFEVGGESFVAFTRPCCECGGYSKRAYKLDGDRSALVYANYDWSD